MKKLLTMFLSVVMVLSMSLSAFAAGWQKDNTGWWYGTNADNSTWYSNGWQWIDGNQDGTAECYYFDSNGYMLANTTTPDGYQVNSDGAWVVNGALQTKQLDPHTNPITVAQDATNGSEVLDGKSVAQIVPNRELVDMFTINGLDKMPNKTYVSEGSFGPTYSAEYRGNLIKFETVTDYNLINCFIGRADQVLDNIPANGIELNAYYDNTGFENADGGRRLTASTGTSDQDFGLATGTYRMTNIRFDNRDHYISIVLTHGNDGNWYIYPDSQAFMR